MNNKYILLVTLFFSIFSLGLSAQSKYPAPPENDSKEVMDKYQKAVDQWYLENPKTEEKKSIEPEKSIESEIIAGPNLTTKDIPQDAQVWKLLTVKVVENGVVDEKLNDYQQAFIDKFTSNKLRIHIHQNRFLYVHENDGIVKKFALTIAEKEMSLKEDNCPKCLEHSSKIITFDASSLITEKEFIDDKGNRFTIRFNYSPS